MRITVMFWVSKKAKEYCLLILSAQ